MTPPLGLLTVAAVLPTEWSLRWVDENVNQLRDEDIDGSDLVMIGSKIVGRARALSVIQRVKERGKPVAGGGPDPTLSTSHYEGSGADHIGSGEGEVTVPMSARPLPSRMLRSPVVQRVRGMDHDWRGAARHSAHFAPAPTPAAFSFAPFESRASSQFRRATPAALRYRANASWYVFTQWGCDWSARYLRTSWVWAERRWLDWDVPHSVKLIGGARFRNSSAPQVSPGSERPPIGFNRSPLPPWPIVRAQSPAEVPACRDCEVLGVGDIGCQGRSAGGGAPVRPALHPPPTFAPFPSVLLA